MLFFLPTVENMLYTDFEDIVSQQRMARYLIACADDKRRAITLYRANIRLSNELFSILCMFEVAIRNSIDKHHKNKWGANWLFDATQVRGGFLRSAGCERSLENVQKVIAKLGASYSHDRAVTGLMFGFWTSQFATKEFAAAGSSLLNILPARPFGTNQTKVFKKLTSINHIRNRIAHHEPICFTAPTVISTVYAEQQYNQIIEVLQWLGINPTSFLFGIDGFLRKKELVDRLT
ncbi:MAG TPA: hypothetical protein VL547_23635 [Dinghuibacter sp.]|uniref:hypothetical protein n=1 Tax=Dinghuibacter sp. TaxID=2024697 RepID=UPI002C9A8545|nr:hypothetical protein [Dinghuibacter sp.]HTJ15057.1 hypothetical protein [Dinghuibacter sp.]